MPDRFQFDVFLSHSAKDKAVVRPLAERLRADGVPNNSQPSTFNSQPPPGTFRFRDPLNKDRRFLPLRLDDAPDQRHAGAKNSRSPAPLTYFTP